MGAVGTVLVCIGVSEFDKPGNFTGTRRVSEPLKMRDMVDVLAHNKPLQCYIASNASDKLAQQVGSQAVINTLLFGILIGNMGLSTMLPSSTHTPVWFCAAAARASRSRRAWRISF